MLTVRIAYVSVALLLASLEGCATAPHVRIAPAVLHVRGVTEDHDLARRNPAMLQAAYEDEWRVARLTGPPVHCLALSGGGIRAAAFSLGVMRALDERRLFEKLDLISAVSGGAYAAAWYYAERVAAQTANDDNPLRGDGPWNELGRRAEFVTPPEYLFRTGINVLAIPLNVLVNGVFALDIPVTATRPWYEQRIRSVFMKDRQLTFDEVRQWLETRNSKVPFPIINATAYIDDDRHYHGARLANSVFEFTPVWYGSDAFGYRLAAPGNIDVARAVAISGAALDTSQIPGSSQKTWARVFNQDLGYFVANFHPDRSDRDSIAAYAPFPIYFFARGGVRDVKARNVYLTDGGHSENLGMFSLVKRLCGTIFVVDAEHDPDYSFDAYFKLRDALTREMGVSFRVDAIDSLRGDGIWCHYGEQGVDRHCQAWPWSPSCLGTSGGTAPAVRKRQIARIDWCLEEQRPKLVMEGQIDSFPYLEPDGRTVKRTIRVVYIKLAMDAQSGMKDVYGPTVWDYHAKSRQDNPRGCSGVWLWRSCEFPQEPTSDQNFSGRQFDAYNELGYRNVLLCLAEDATVNAHASCAPAGSRGRGDSPRDLGGSTSP